MLKSSDIRVISKFGKVEWLLLGGILATGTILAVILALIVQSL